MSQNKENLKEKEKGIDPKDKGKKRIEEEDESDTESEGITKAEKKFKQLTNDEEVARKARLNADKMLAEKLQEEEREISKAIRNKPPLRNQLRNQMMTYLKHVGGKKHSYLKNKTIEEIQVLYERLKRQDQNFVVIRSAKDERQIKELNKDPEKKKLKKRVVNEEDTAKIVKLWRKKLFIARMQKVSSPDGNYLVVYRVNGHFRAFNYLMEALHIFDR
ncbi:hypothetical protein Tco_1486514 [Tanacetum coccineum]